MVSGTAYLTRDGAQLLIKEALDKFEDDVIREITTDVKTMTRAFDRARGALWMLGVVLGVPGVILVCLQIFGKGH